MAACCDNLRALSREPALALIAGNKERGANDTTGGGGGIC